ncbi:MAG: acetate--CoA ligase family protein [Lautropia sp.]
MSRLLNPSSIAVIGAAGDPTRIRGRPIANLKISGYTGKVFAVNPGRAEVQGLKGYPDVHALPETPDLGVIAVPAPAVLKTVEQCAEVGIRSLVILSGIPPDQEREVHRRLGQLARERDLHILGPNSLGFYRPLANLAVTFAPMDPARFSSRPAAPRVSIISQSGSTAHGIFERCQDAGLSVSSVLMPGNESDLDVTQLLEYLLESEPVDAFLLFLEGIGDGERFARALARAVRQGIPVIAMKIGRSSAGVRAAVSHTAHLTGSDAAYDAVFERYRVARVWDADEMVSVARLLARGKRMAGNRLAIVTTGGGAGGIASDLFEANGLVVPSLSADTRNALRDIVPAHGSLENPIDVGTTMDDDGRRFGATLAAMHRSDEVDGTLAVLNLAIPDTVRMLEPTLRQIARDGNKPVIFYSSATPDPANVSGLSALGFDVLTMRPALWAFQGMTRHGTGEAVAEPTSAGVSSRPADWSYARRSDLLREFRIPVALTKIVTGKEQSMQAAAAIGFPVALKVESPDLPHKTDAGALQLDLQDEEQVARAYDAILASARAYAPNAIVEGVLVQEMAAPGCEMLVGMVRDDTFGPQILLGFGGTYAEVLNDSVVVPLPLDAAAARRMIARLRGTRILRGIRGEPPADTEALAELLVNLSRLIERESWIKEVEFNPVIVYAAGRGLKVVDTLFIDR